MIRYAARVPIAQGGDALGASRGLGPAVAVIDLDALRANCALAMRLAAGRRVIAVVKADGYGHGAVAVARALAGAGVGALATWSVGEAAALRDAGIAVPLLVLSGVRDAAEADEVVARRWGAVVHDAGGRAMLSAAARRAGDARASVHVEVDTGMRRMGVPASDAESFIAEAARDPALALDGVMTHFARADESDLAPTREQLREFAQLVDALRRRGVAPARYTSRTPRHSSPRTRSKGRVPPQDACGRASCSTAPNPLHSGPLRCGR
jgi:alanine racemase